MTAEDRAPGRQSQISDRGATNRRLTDLPGEASSDVVDLDFTAAGHLYATHSLHAFAARWVSSTSRCTVPVMVTGATDGHRLVETEACQVRRYHCPSARRSLLR